MELKTIKRRAIRGGFSLTFRRIALLAINFITLNIILAKILPVSTLGIFIIANSILAFFTFFSDIGLAAALIRKKELLKDDLKTTFTIQEILAVIITVVIWFFAPTITSVYQLDTSSIWLIRALAVGFLLTSLKVIPSILLERELKFGKLVWVELFETLVFNGLLVYLTLAGLGIDAFTYSVLARGIVGAILMYLISPWKVSLGIARSSAKELLDYGIPFQLNSFLALLKDQLVRLIVAGVVGSQGIGFIGQGQRIAFLPLEVMNIITRVAFPTFSRLQHDKESLKKALESSLFATALFLYPMLFGILAIAPSLFEYLGTDKWGPALPLVYLYGINAFWSTFSSPFTNFLNAIGKINITLKLMIMWTILEWILAPILTIQYGFVGMGYASAIISFTAIIPVIIIKKMISIDILSNVWQPLFSSILMSIIIFYLSKIIIPELPTIIIMICCGALIYFGLIYLLAKSKIKSAYKEFLDAFRNR
jgi:O-antigen/teichoic acid export membrane protein